ncbi:MAG: glucosamine-6-phosphate deaminase [Bacteroidota bacterium]
MEIQIFEDYSALCENVAEIIVNQIQKKPDSLICLGSGDTPLGVFEILVKQGEDLDFSKVNFVGLDEWLGMDENDEGSCFYTMFQKLFIPLELKAEQIHCFDAKSDQLETECKKIDHLIDSNGGLDLILLGIGTNGHLAMNEPGTPFAIGCHVSKLAESTILTGQKYFKNSTPLALGITVGLRHIAEAKTIILMANGAKKAEIIHQTVHSKPNTALPSSILNTLPNSFLLVDKEAGNLL